MVDTAPARAHARYLSDDADAVVSLPGYLAANPGQVSGGDVFEYDAGFSDDLLDSPRFEAVDSDEVAGYSPNERETKATLAARLGVSPSSYTKAELVGMADAQDRANPAPPSDPAHVEPAPAPTDDATSEGSQA